MKEKSKFLGKYRGTSHRLKRFDYGSCAFYFITICTKSRIPYFGEIVYENGDDLSIPEPRCARNPPTVGPHNPPTVCACNPPTVGARNPPTVGARNCAHLPLGNVEFNQPRKKMVLTEIGRIAFNYWKSIPIHYPFVELYEFVIMPDHMHGIIQLSEKQHEGWKPNEFGLQAKNIPAIIRAYKASVKRYANENAIPFHWQPRYYDSVFKCQMQLYITNNYIRKNVEKWKLNK